ncbi:MAG TPA: DUF2490 domain-containing protein [Cyclobacteriaceae bacterium]|nr:DUF2490 domain-containing protein [Cyclobacteriaceae bacterium]
MIRKVALALTIAALLPELTFAQTAPRAVVAQPIEWSSLTSNVKVNKYLSLQLEGQFRFAHTFQPMQFQFRTAAEIHLTKKLSIVPIGYVYTANPVYGKQPAKFVNNEHRLWQQVMFKHKAGRVHLSHRARIEQRYIQVHTINNGEVVNEGFDYFANRARFRFMMNVPFGNKEMGPKTVFGSFYEEVFVSWGPKTTFHKPDQNRVFAGVGYQVTKDFTVTSGLIYQMLIKANGTMQENNLGVQVMVGYNFDLTD